MQTITVAPGTELRGVFMEAAKHSHVRVVLQPGHHSWFTNSDWEYDPNHGWYNNGPREFGEDEHLVIDHPHLELVGPEECTFISHHIWYDPSKVTIDPRLKNLHTIMYHTMNGVTYARCGDVVPADWHHVSGITPGELLIIPDIDEPYNDESCWEGIDKLDADVKDYLGNVFPESFHTLED